MPHPAIRFQVEPHADAALTGRDVVVTAGVSLYLDILGLVPGELCDQFWAAFWDEIAGDIEARLAAAMAVPGLSEKVRAAADELFAERLAAANLTAASVPV